MEKKTKLVIALVGGFIGAYLLRDYLGYYNVPVSFLLYGFIVVMYAMYYGQLGAWRYASPQLIAPNFHASVMFDPYEIPNTDYVAIPIGSYYAPAMLMASEGGEGTLITLKNCIRKVPPNYLGLIAVGRIMQRARYDIEYGENYKGGSNFYCFCPMMEFEIDSLAPEITDFLKSSPTKFKAPFFFGYAIDESKLKDSVKCPHCEHNVEIFFTKDEKAEYMKAIKTLSVAYADTNKIIHTHKELVRGNFKVVTEATDVLGGIQKSLNKVDWKTRLSDRDRTKIERDDNF